MELSFKNASSTRAFAQELIFINPNFPFVCAEIEGPTLGSDSLDFVALSLTDLGALSTASRSLLVILKIEQVRILFFRSV